MWWSCPATSTRRWARRSPPRSSRSPSRISRQACAATTARCRRSTTASSPTTSPTCCLRRAATPTRTSPPRASRAERIRFVGNVMIDSLRRYEARARELDVGRRELGVEDYLLVTLHRPSLVDDPERLVEVDGGARGDRDRAARSSSRSIRAPARCSTSSGWRGRRVRLLEPQRYLRFLSLLIDASAVLTDSGGIQEETTVLGVPCFTLRTTTERPITVSEGTNRVLGTGPRRSRASSELLPPRTPRPGRAPEGWDGRAARRAPPMRSLERFGDTSSARRAAREYGLSDAPARPGSPLRRPSRRSRSLTRSRRRGEVLVRTTWSLISAGNRAGASPQTAGKSLLGKARDRPDQARQVIDKARREGLRADARRRARPARRPAHAGLLERRRRRAGRRRRRGAFESAIASAASARTPRCMPRRSRSRPRSAFRFPDGLDDRWGAFGALGAIAAHGVRVAGVEAGSVGRRDRPRARRPARGAARHGRRRARRSGSIPIAGRVELAARLGAAAAVRPIRDEAEAARRGDKRRPRRRLP